MDFNQMAQRVKNDPALVEKISQSSDGQALMRLLGQTGGDTFQHVTQEGVGGNYAEMMKLLQQVMASQEGRSLLQRLGEQLK